MAGCQKGMSFLLGLEDDMCFKALHLQFLFFSFKVVEFKMYQCR